MVPTLGSLRGQVVLAVTGAWLLMILVVFASLLPRVGSRLVRVEEERALAISEGIASEIETNLGALQLVGRGIHVDVLVSDIDLPGLNGLELALS